MKLHSLKITGFKRLKTVEIFFGDATFLIGKNNCGKSSILKAIEVLLSAKKQLTSYDFHSILDEDTNEVKVNIHTIVLEAEFRNLPLDANDWRGFKGRIFKYKVPIGASDTGLAVIYRKTYKLGDDVIIEFKSKERKLNSNFIGLKTPQEYIDKGISAELIKALFSDLGKNITEKQKDKLDEIDEIWDLLETETWVKNPGGIPGNVLKMLPRLLLIPVDVGINEIQGTGSGVLSKTLSELFETVRENSDNFKNAQFHLTNLAKELDAADPSSKFGEMMGELNTVLSKVFPDSMLHATTNLSDPTTLKPNFNVEMSSNIRTPVDNQGTGIVRAAVFGMLRYRQKWLSARENENNRSLIICFEEPEIYLHPSAANQMRDAIYELSSSASQIIATTHSPYLIDISRKPKQVLNRLYSCGNHVECNAFSVSEEFTKLQNDDKQYVKMILKIDDHISRIFFTKHVIIIEGDTEEILIKETLRRLDKEKFLNIISNFEIIKARGKAAIISLVRYLRSMNINPIVIHDSDLTTPNAARFNAPIAEALGTNGLIIKMNNCVEDEIGYTAQTEKPFSAYKQTELWGDRWEDVPEQWRAKMKEIFTEYI